jgi:heavy metal sensor kinase
VSIRLRLALVCAVLALAVLGVGGLLFTNALRTELLAQVESELYSRAGAIASALQAGAPPDAETSQVVGPQDIFVQVVDPDGRIVAASAAAVASPLLSSTELRSVGSSATSIDHSLANVDRQPRPDRLRLAAVRTRTPTGPLVVIVGSSLDPVDDAVNQVTSELVVAAAAVVPLTGVGAWVLARTALRPVERLRRDVARISDRDERSRLRTPRTRDELAALGETMNGLLARLQAALVRERRLVADAAHELRTPLAILRTELELAGRRGRTREELIEAVANAAQETDRLVRLAEDLLFLARTDEGAPLLRTEPHRLLEVVDEATDRQAQRAVAGGVEIRLEVPEELVVVLDEVRVRQAVENLLDNALRMAPAGTAITVAGSAEGGMAAISVSDSGPGFPPDFLPHAFERFRRADDSRARQGGGSGLGLAIVDAIARAHGGRAEAANRPQGGATVSLVIPLHGPAAGGGPRTVPAVLGAPSEVTVA